MTFGLRYRVPLLGGIISAGAVLALCLTVYESQRGTTPPLDPSQIRNMESRQTFLKSVVKPMLMGRIDDALRKNGFCNPMCGVNSERRESMRVIIERNELLIVTILWAVAQLENDDVMVTLRRATSKKGGLAAVRLTGAWRDLQQALFVTEAFCEEDKYADILNKRHWKVVCKRSSNPSALAMYGNYVPPSSLDEDFYMEIRREDDFSEYRNPAKFK